MGPATSERKKLIWDYTYRLLSLLLKKISTDGPRTYGFEYEFLPETPPTSDCIDKLYACLETLGFYPEGKMFYNAEGMGVTFEPGGQIEYHSTPISARDEEAFLSTLGVIANINETIRQECGINYLAKGYIPGRAAAPLCLSAKRYLNLHERLAKVDTRGLEMMKGTASIHLHAAIQTLEELPALFQLLQQLAQSPDFRMSPERRDIWDHTDPCRCGMPYDAVEAHTAPRDVLSEFVRVAVDAEVLGEDVPFHESSDTGFNAFKYHFTTIFTDIRLNLASATLELRTPDSMPAGEFFETWKRFIKAVEEAV